MSTPTSFSGLSGNVALKIMDLSTMITNYFPAPQPNQATIIKTIAIEFTMTMAQLTDCRLALLFSTQSWADQAAVGTSFSTVENALSLGSGSQEYEFIDLGPLTKMGVSGNGTALLFMQYYRGKFKVPRSACEHLNDSINPVHGSLILIGKQNSSSFASTGLLEAKFDYFHHINTANSLLK